MQLRRFVLDSGELVAGIVSLTKSIALAVLNDLERRRMVRRQRDPDDRRCHIVTIAAAGIKELDRTQHRLAAVEDRVLGGLTHDERASVHDLLMHATGGQIPRHICTAFETR